MKAFSSGAGDIVPMLAESLAVRLTLCLTSLIGGITPMLTALFRTAGLFQQAARRGNECKKKLSTPGWVEGDARRITRRPQS